MSKGSLITLRTTVIRWQSPFRETDRSDAATQAVLQSPVSEKVIEAVGLTKIYAGAPRSAVEDLHLHVAAGEVFGFLGENGAGKTTTIKMLNGLILPTAGQARILGHDIQAEPLAAKRLLGYIPDNPFLYEKLTGTEFMDFIGDLYQIPRGPVRRARIADLLALFDLDTKADTLIGGYSRGMRQKIALAATLLHEPRALFLDEPTVGLDPKSTRRLQDVLRTVAGRGAAVFLSTHVLEVAAGLCDRIGILHRGHLVALGTPTELTQNGKRTLEEVFLQHTGGAGERDEVLRLLGGGNGSSNGEETE
jgi:ABC-2 type transport system ATP-binding protein